MKNMENYKRRYYGCGKGPLISELSKVRRFNEGPHQYIGVNYRSVKAAKGQAQKCKLYNKKPHPNFCTTNKFERLKKPLKVDLIFIRNVIHEIPLMEVGRRFYHVLTSLKIGGDLDMRRLLQGEAKAVTWEEEEDQKGNGIIRRR